VVQEDNVLVEISGLYVNFYTYQGVVQAIEGVDLTIRKGETLGLVGETGCGKSVTASTIMKLILSPPGKIESGSIYFMEPPEVRTKRREYEARAQKWYSDLTPELKRQTIRSHGLRFTGFKKRAKRLSPEEIKKLAIPTTAPHKVVSSYMSEIAKSVRKDDRIALDALRKNYDLIPKSNEYMQKIRGKWISMIFQEPTSALNPVFTAGDQIAEVILLHRKGDMAERALKRIGTEIELMKKSKRPRKIRIPVEATITDTKAVGRSASRLVCSVCNADVEEQDRWCDKCGVVFYSALLWSVRRPALETYRRFILYAKKNPGARNTFLSKIPLIRRYNDYLIVEARREAVQMLEVVRIPDPKGVAERYPYELSGGMQQRVMIAIALACNPKLLIADEPTTALDVTIQGQILKLMRDLKEIYGSSILLITHNLGVVAEMCDRVGVMYAGSMVEIGTAREIYKKPLHPYTKGLMKSVPSVQGDVEKLFTIRGSVPNLVFPPRGCRFHPRCDFAKTYCTEVRPELAELEEGHFVSCHMAAEVSGYARSNPLK
jgi:peptide/nickel transport system ATP-binding protein